MNPHLKRYLRRLGVGLVIATGVMLFGALLTGVYIVGYAFFADLLGLGDLNSAAGIGEIVLGMVLMILLVVVAVVTLNECLEIV